MSKKEEFKNILWQFTQIYLMSKDGFLYSRYLHNPKTDEEKTYINGNIHLRMMRHMIWNFSAIELHKLISKKNNDKLRIISIFNKLKPGGIFSSLNFKEEKINYFENILNLHSNVINKIISFRDSVYAHTDIVKMEELKSDKITFDEVEMLHKSIEEIIKELYLDIYETDFMLESPAFQEGKFNMIDILAKEQNRRIGNLQ